VQLSKSEILNKSELLNFPAFFFQGEPVPRIGRWLSQGKFIVKQQIIIDEDGVVVLFYFE